MNKFVFIAPTFNAEKTAKQALLSLAGQSYENWELIVIDDCSTDNTEGLIRGWMETLHLEHKLVYISNTGKQWEVANVLDGLKLCSDDDIICRMDMDDYLTELNALQIIDMAYKSNPELDVAWTAHRWFDGDKLSGVNISNDLPRGSDPYKHQWVSSHFKTFRKRLLNGVKDENFRGEDGNYFKRIGDQSFMLPALHNARQWLFIPMCMYAYRCSLTPETFQTDDAKFQANEGSFLRNRGYIK